MFQVFSDFKPAGDQPQAIASLTKGIKKNLDFQTLLGVTGSGKTFTVAKLIEEVQKPTLVIAHNKTLAAQLTQEFRTFFPKNAVEYFVSYYDYYQPEAYMPGTDTYIEKEAQINEEIDRLRHSATSSLLSRRDVIVVASVSCIYGLGSPEFYENISLRFEKGDTINREEVIKKLIDNHFDRSDLLSRGKFRVRGENFEIVPTGREVVIRIKAKNGIITDISEYDLFSREELGSLDKALIYPAKHFVVPEPVVTEALKEIEQEMKEQVKFFKSHKKLLEAERIRRRTLQDLEMIKEIGYCNGIENYSRYLSGRQKGEAPYTLIDYFPKDFLMVIDESHVTVPQIGGMYEGDRSRKKTLIENGFRLPSALDNRPLHFTEFEEKINQLVFTSATPGKYEKQKTQKIVEQIIRPTGLVDPEITVKKAEGQIKDVVEEIESNILKKERVLVTTLTKKMAEDLSAFLREKKIKSSYIHSDVDTLERINILNKLRKGEFDVLIGVNLLREGLDLPEVSLVAILDADKEGFLRNETSLIQTIGRAARNVSGRVILYADRITGSMERAIHETSRRRKKQIAYNLKNNITPQTIQKQIKSITDGGSILSKNRDFTRLASLENIESYIKQRETEMKEAARNLEFEKAAFIRDEIGELHKLRHKD